MEQICSSPSHESTPSGFENTAITIQNGNIFCPDCDIYCSGEKNFKQHLSGVRHRRNVSLKQSEYSCRICCVDLNSKLQLTNHLLGVRHKRKSVNSSNLDTSNSTEGTSPGCSRNLFHSPLKRNRIMSDELASSFLSRRSGHLSSPLQNISSYSIVTSFQIPDILSLLPRFSIDSSSIVSTNCSKVVSLDGPCFFVSETSDAEINASINTVFDETLQSLSLLESKLAKKLSSTSLAGRAILKRKTVALNRYSSAVKTFHHFAKFSLHNWLPSSKSRRASPFIGESFTNANFCSHTLCLTFRGLLHYKNGLKRTLLRLKSLNSGSL